MARSSSSVLSSSKITFRYFITHTAAFLSGIFLATLIFTALHLSYDDHGLGEKASSGVNGNGVELNHDGQLRRTDLGNNIDVNIDGKSAVNESEGNLNRDGGKSDKSTRQQSDSETNASGGDKIEASIRRAIGDSYSNYYHQNDIPFNFDDDGGTDGLCSILPKPTPTTLSLWSHQLPRILNATKHPADRDFEFRDYTALLLNALSPERLQRGVKTLPLDWTLVERALRVLHNRFLYVQDQADKYRKAQSTHNSDNKARRLLGTFDIPKNIMERINNDQSPNVPRKLNILVMGGSVTMGVVCHLNPVTTQTGKYSRRACAWPGRLASFLTQILGGYELIHVHTIALGGTNTESGITMWDYSLLPQDVPYPDIVINAYATNDMHYNSVMDALSKNKTVAESVFDLSQAFIRQVLTPKKSSCQHDSPPPLLLYFDDYIGNEQNEIYTTMVSSQTIHMLSGYYGLGSISYADVVRDIIYGDTKEWWFSPNWYEDSKTYNRAVHPHMGMHISAVWVIAYYLFHLFTQFCSLPLVDPQRADNLEEGVDLSQRNQRQLYRHHAGREQSNNIGEWDYGYRPMYGLPPLEQSKQLVGGPKQKPRGIPPPLTPELSLEHVSALWKNDANSSPGLWKSQEQCHQEQQKLGDLSSSSSNTNALPKPCLYSWVSMLERFLDTPDRLTKKLQPFLLTNNGWVASNDNNKLGWVPKIDNPRKDAHPCQFTMQWKQITMPVKAITFMIMRSYGDKWAQSKIRVKVYSDDTLLKDTEIVGYHDKKTSETYNIKIMLNEGNDAGDGGVEVGKDLKIDVGLVGGTTFKISGMAICDH